MDEVYHWNELPAQVEAILSEVWIKIDVDKQLQQAQEKIDEINNGHSEIGEMFNNVEQGLIDLDSELHPTNSNGEQTSFYADIEDVLTKVNGGIRDLHLKIDEYESCQDDTNDGQKSEEGFIFADSDDSTSTPSSPVFTPHKKQELVDITCIQADNSDSTSTNADTNIHETSKELEPSETATRTDSIQAKETSSTSPATQSTPKDKCKPVHVLRSKTQQDSSSSSCTNQVGSSHQIPKDSACSTRPSQLRKMTSKPPVRTPPKQPVRGTPVSNTSRKQVKKEPVSVNSVRGMSKEGKKAPYIEPDVIDLCNDEQDDVIDCSQVKTKKIHVQDRGIKLTLGSRVLALRKNNVWCDGTITSIIKDSSSHSQQKYKLKFDDEGMALISGKHIAIKSYPKPSKLHVGSRIVAEYMNEAVSSQVFLSAGIVAEVPMYNNQSRYLVFFDDGFAQYNVLTKIHLVYEASDNVWEDMSEECVEFIKEYLEKYPERPMVRLHCGQCIKTEWKGIWWRAKVLKVDGSLVHMTFPNDKRNEWIYRGSPRLEPLHRELETAKYLRESGRLIANSSVTKKRGGPCVEYQRVKPDLMVPAVDILAVAEGKTPLIKPMFKPLSRGGCTSRPVDDMPVVQWAVVTLKKWCESHNLSPRFEDLSNEDLGGLLERVYTEGHHEQPDVFTDETLYGLRCSLSTYFTEPPISRKIDLYRDAEFAKANKAFMAITQYEDIHQVEMKPMMPRPGLNRRDMVKLLKSGLVSLNNPLGLLRLVWIFMQPFIGRAKGKIKSPDLHLLQLKHVLCKVAKSGLPYYEINAPSLGLSDGQEQRIYATGNRFYCPHRSISLYLSKTNPECPDFLQQPRTKISFKHEAVWFEAKPLDPSAINTLMQDVASAAKLSRPYSNADIRATPWANLLEAIEDFSEHLRMGYRKNTQVTSASAMTTTTTSRSVVGKQGNVQPIRGVPDKSNSRQSPLKPSIQDGLSTQSGKEIVLPKYPTKLQSTGQTDSDDDVVFIEMKTQSTGVKEHSLERQQTAKKSTSHRHHHHHHHYHDSMHRHTHYGRNSHDSLKAGSHFSHHHRKHLAVKHIKKVFVAHQCSVKCVENCTPDKHRKEKMKFPNPLQVPSMNGWIRRLAKRSGNGKRHVVYHAPCGRSLRNMAEIDRYLTETKTKDICVDAFTFSPFVYTKLLRRDRIRRKPYFKISDISKGSELVPVSLVNEIDYEQPPDVKYIATRQPEKGSEIIIDTDFLICCDCTDNCKDNSKCACRQLTRKTAEDFPEINKNLSEIGYKYRRLKSLVPTGIYECNSKCACSKQCHNRVAQNGLSLRLQVFKTDKRGWGLRCLDDIPEGAFVCTYAGQLWGAEEANIRGQQHGDEYFAELDHIEVVENSKEGYESDPMEDEGISDSKESVLSNSSMSDQSLTSDDDYNASSASETSSIAVDVENQSDDSNSMSKVQSGDSLATKMVFRRQQPETRTGSMVEGSWSVAFPYKDSTQSKVEAWVNSNPIQTNTDDNAMNDTTAKAVINEASVSRMQRRAPTSSIADSSDRSNKDNGSLIDYKPLARKSVGSKKEHNMADKKNARKDSNKDNGEEPNRDSCTSSIFKYGYNTSPGKVLDKSQIEAFKRRSHTSRLHMRKKPQGANDEMKSASVTSGGDTSESEYSNSTDKGKSEIKSVSKSQHGNLMPTTSTPLTASKDTGTKENENKMQFIRTRSFFGESSGHVMDAKFIGNLGRYLNHSCRPNLFVQNVFVDSHDLRFPWVAFFTRELVRAGSELTWDYNYDVGSVPGKSLICLCGTRECRGRLL